MKKVIFAFAAGQMLQLVILTVGMSLTYSTNLVVFCAVIGIVATLMMLIGSAMATLEMVSSADEMEETAPIPEEIKVSNDKITRTEEATIDALFSRKAEK